MLAYSLTAFILFAAQQTPRAPCTLAGPPVAAQWSGAIPPASTAHAPLRAVTDVPLPGSASRFDYQSLEPASGRLFISHMGAGQLVVFDVHAGKVIGIWTYFLRWRACSPCRPNTERMRPRRAITQSWSLTIRRFGSWREFRGRGFRTGSRTLRRSGECSSRTNRGGATL